MHSPRVLWRRPKMKGPRRLITRGVDQHIERRTEKKLSAEEPPRSRDLARRLVELVMFAASIVCMRWRGRAALAGHEPGLDGIKMSGAAGLFQHGDAPVSI